MFLIVPKTHLQTCRTLFHHGVTCFLRHDFFPTVRWVFFHLAALFAAQDSKTHVSSMEDGDFFSHEKSVTGIGVGMGVGTWEIT